MRTADRPAPLVARTDVPEPLRGRTSAQSRGRLATFVQRYGWRAYAIPILTLATIAVLVDLALTTPRVPTGTTGAASATTAARSTAPPVAEAAPPAPAEGDVDPTEPAPTVGVESYVEEGAGSLSVVDGSSGVYGAGPLNRFIVEVEDGIGVDGAGFAQAVEATLGDPRSWGNGGQRSFQRVGVAEAQAGAFDFKVSLVSPGSMERYCPGVGTGGYTSCRYGERAVINLARWATAVPDYEGDVATYRLYVVNHEVGHVFGNGHLDCPGAGQPAPVMQQQTLGLDGCQKNAWPYP
ncbi:DUF3152 domain-containing protein [Blastococcus haudaquaticus]|uniref:DUF3152 domain-containing protein n=1 Tax=Blastococcus haudaquaticus TaxID=1938745 RepID=A0A286GDK9_9ACTN|nr:DUF3152 domain-containing protein [Blastococcus haudaquaticus]SOD93591.1 Protein of unknown function [Blastococcus haudaquaticus]